MDEPKVLRAVDPAKDVDGFHSSNAELYPRRAVPRPGDAVGRDGDARGARVELKGKEAVVIGRSEIVGKPMAMLLLAEHATVTICHSRTVDLAAHTRRADVLVALSAARGS
jgi:methylenetetrahydrofolate dehydrogenase (NADP+)/methenyltetrahydrofolate cyclohydrolase